jgi:hypothetical protein
LFDKTKASPAEVVAEVWRLLEAGDYVGAAGFHIPEFAEYAANQSARDANPRPAKPRSAEAMLERYPDMPREVAEYEAAQARKQPQPTPYFGAVFGINSKSELEALSPEQILARRLQASDWRTVFDPISSGFLSNTPSTVINWRGSIERRIRFMRISPIRPELIMSDELC